MSGAGPTDSGSHLGWAFQNVLRLGFSLFASESFPPPVHGPSPCLTETGKFHDCLPALGPWKASRSSVPPALAPQLCLCPPLFSPFFRVSLLSPSSAPLKDQDYLSGLQVRRLKPH